MTAKDAMHGQKLYRCTDEALLSEQRICQERIYDFNRTRPSETAERQRLLAEVFASVGEDCIVEPPLHANWGCHTHLGRNVYANFNLTLVDDTDIFVGDDVLFGPNVTLSTAGHPVDPDLRRDAYQFNIPIHIENNVWIGANSVVLPGVRIGANTVIGAGSVVTKSIESDVVAVGNPCRVLRRIGEHDRQYYFRDMRIPPRETL